MTRPEKIGYPLPSTIARRKTPRPEKIYHPPISPEEIERLLADPECDEYFRAFYGKVVPAPRTTCAACHKLLPESKHERRYCGPACRQKFYRRLKAIRKRGNYRLPMVLTPEELAAEEAEAKAQAIAHDKALGAKSIQFDTYPRFPEVQDHLPTRY
jgi:hypothetical protein